MNIKEILDEAILIMHLSLEHENINCGYYFWKGPHGVWK